MGTLATLAPVILSFLGGPAGGLAGAGLQWLASKFGASDQTVAAIQTAMTNADPIALRRLDVDFQEYCMANAIALPLAQIGVNQVEAASSSVFVAGWRPACGWIGALALAYSAIIEPVARFVGTVVFNYAGSYPAIDTSLTAQVLFGILGIGAMRSFDKLKGTAS